jgi:hypothetical protein
VELTRGGSRGRSTEIRERQELDARQSVCLRSEHQELASPEIAIEGIDWTEEHSRSSFRGELSACATKAEAGQDPPRGKSVLTGDINFCESYVKEKYSLMRLILLRFSCLIPAEYYSLSYQLRIELL